MEIMTGNRFNSIAIDVMQIHASTDHAMSSLDKVCRKLCSGCCHQSVGIFAPEGLVIENYINTEMPTNLKKVVRRQVVEWMGTFNSLTRPATIKEPLTVQEFQFAEQEIARQKIPCPLLVDRACSIYPVRPTACRTYAANDDPKFCETVPPRSTMPEASNIKLQATKAVAELVNPMQLRPLIHAIVESVGARKFIEFRPVAFPASMSRNARYSLL